MQPLTIYDVHVDIGTAIATASHFPDPGYRHSALGSQLQAGFAVALIPLVTWSAAWPALIRRPGLRWVRHLINCPISWK